MKLICGHPSFPKLHHPKAWTFPRHKILCVATIGVFDGIHLGHQFILKKVVKEARRKKSASLVITFDRPPQVVLNKPFSGCISTPEEKKHLFRASGIDYIWLLATTKRLLNLSAEKFLLYILRHFTISTLFVGEGFKFGRNAASDILELTRLSKKYNFNLVIVRKKKIRGEIVSSSLIRKLVARGRFIQAKKFLGRDYILQGKVVHGNAIGRKLGFPTANIDVANLAIPEEGVYAAFTEVEARVYLSAVNIGKPHSTKILRPPVVETHLIGFNEDILNKKIKILFIEKIRKEKKIYSKAALINNISRDVREIVKKHAFFNKKIISARLKI
ncbi:MAG: bifunctional riboflavin kinase/FAD synthetase [Candidatus Omnitrophica bacterium]|nr:bifunctional riboflavin kinase/FAD synthetase [Candidatus Omnitrophota bacterium]